jgi:hypothetical protein
MKEMLDEEKFLQTVSLSDHPSDKARSRECFAQVIAFESRIKYDKGPKGNVKSSKGFSGYE